jgi:hypothetical protein
MSHRAHPSHARFDRRSRPTVISVRADSRNVTIQDAIFYHRWSSYADPANSALPWAPRSLRLQRCKSIAPSL